MRARRAGCRRRHRPRGRDLSSPFPGYAVRPADFDAHRPNFRIRRSCSLSARRPKAGRRCGSIHRLGDATFGGKLKAYHALDAVRLQYDRCRQRDRPWTGRLRSLPADVGDLGDVRAHKPDNAAIPHWAPYTLSERATLILNSESRVANDHDRETRMLWEGNCQRLT